MSLRAVNGVKVIKSKIYAPTGATVRGVDATHKLSANSDLVNTLPSIGSVISAPPL